MQTTAGPEQDASSTETHMQTCTFSNRSEEVQVELQARNARRDIILDYKYYTFEPQVLLHK